MKQIKYATWSIASTWIWRTVMLKIRMQGTLKDIRWFKRLMERHKEIKVKDVSQPFKNKGTNQYVRVYAEIKKEDK